jgi:uncharacterized protein (TIGR04255 family)
MLQSLPEKLKHDAIVDAVFEVRFELPPRTVPEIIYGRLSDVPEWKDLLPRRLPEADIPAFIRRLEPSFRNQPAFALSSKEGRKTVRIGPNMFAYSRLAPYPGWSEFGPEIEKAVDALFNAAPEIKVTRLGFRYINALRSDLHGVSGIEQFNATLKLSNEPLTTSFNLNYSLPAFDDTTVSIRVATVDLAQGNIPENTTMIADIDIYTREGFETHDKDAIKKWVDQAHTCEKAKFFGMLKEEIITKLRADA